MDTGTIIAIIVAIVVVALIVGAITMMMSRRKSGQLHERYGSEYDRALKDQGGRRKAEAELSEREKRVSGYEIRDLEAGEREQYMNRWTEIQAKFVDAPRTALQHADILLQEVMGSRGYPVSDFEQRAADLSVDHADFVSDYRAAHGISQKVESATTEQMRQAMLHYRSLFKDLLGTEAPVSA